MKTILITIQRGNLVRNFMQNDFYKILREKFKLVILTPAYNDVEFIEEFGHPNVKFLPLEEKSHTRVDRFFVGLHKFLLYNRYIGYKLKYGIRGLTDKEKLDPFHYYLVTIVFKPLSKIKILREIVRLIDNIFVQKKEVEMFNRIIEEEKPALVLSLAIISDIESALIRAAKKADIPVIGMPKSWDNLSKGGFRSKADLLVVWSDFMVEQAIKYQGYKEKDIQVIGVPQFDYYTDSSRIWSREEFCQKMGLDLDKKIILYCSEGKAIPEDKDFSTTIYDFVKNRELVEDCQLILRPHFAYKNDQKKFAHLIGKPGVVVDQEFTPSSCFKDQWDYSKKQMDRFLNMIYHSDLVVTTASTITLDSCALDKPVINIRFDVCEGIKPFGKSIVWIYTSDYYSEIVDTEAAKLVYSENELRHAINRYLINPKLEECERRLLQKRFCHKIDGNSGKRFADVRSEWAFKR